MKQNNHTLKEANIFIKMVVETSAIVQVVEKLATLCIIFFVLSLSANFNYISCNILLRIKSLIQKSVKKII